MVDSARKQPVDLKMQAAYFKTLSLNELLDPMQMRWSQVKEEKLPLTGTPVSSQPTAYIRSKWADRKTGNVTQVGVKAIHNGQTLAFHLRWRVSPDGSRSGKADEFPDAAAIALDASNSPSFHSMGASGHPLNIWHWRADVLNFGHQVTATGIGTTDRIGETEVKTSALQSPEGWQVVIARNLKTVDHAGLAQLNIGDEVRFAVAVWDGSSEERGGLKAFSPQPLSINISDGGDRS